MSTYHRVYAKIDLNCIYHNITQVKKARPDVAIMPVVKADGYGHGAIETAKVLTELADGYAVAVIEEAIELRDAGITKPILIVGTLSSHHFKTAVLYDIIVPLYTETMAKNLSDAAAALGKTASAHLAIDTGMNRIGMPCTPSSIELVKKISAMPSLDICGIFSHFATADETDKTFSMTQIKRFEDFCSNLKSIGINPQCKHIANSAAIIDMPQTSFNMVRPGIITYGLNPSDEIDKTVLNLKPAMELKTHITHVKRVSAGEGISYGLAYTTSSERIIATVPVGYADGYPRLLSNKGRVIVRGEYAPIVGRICMDQFMIDVTDIDGVSAEDTVTLMGTDGDCFIGADELAAHAMTINYEIICGISKRVPRVYIEKQ